MGISPAQLKRLTLGEIDDWIAAWNAAHADGHQLTAAEEAGIINMLDELPTVH